MVANGPVEGVRVIECASLVTGPAAGSMLAALGAEVIKVEDPVRGDLSRGMTSMFDALQSLPDGSTIQYVTANLGKKSMTLDMQRREGQDILYGLISKSDAFITNYRPSVLKRLGIDEETLRLRNPNIVYAVCSGYGAKGPWSDKRAYDPVVQALSGAMYASGDRDSEEPSMRVGALFDMGAASLLAYGILAALFQRQRTGLGQRVDTSLLRGAVHLQSVLLNTWLLRRWPMQRHTRKRCRNPLCNYYRCADGKWLMVMEPQSERFWRPFCQAIGREDLLHDTQFQSAQTRRENSVALVAVLDEVFAARPRETWLRQFDGSEFVYAPVYDVAEAAEEEQLVANEYVVEVESPSLGKMRCVGPPVQLSKTPARIPHWAPEFGQHTEEVLVDILGKSWEEVQSLREQSIV
ncbi:MAG: CoA transferase [Chloroflexi bacterium]|nr:CoA transferase [Chloroflexota bacterium]